MFQLVLIALGLLATTGVVYAACVFCWVYRSKARSPASRPDFLCPELNRPHGWKNLIQVKARPWTFP
jgi:hypothetical protein